MEMYSDTISIGASTEPLLLVALRLLQLHVAVASPHHTFFGALCLSFATKRTEEKSDSQKNTPRRNSEGKAAEKRGTTERYPTPAIPN